MDKGERAMLATSLVLLYLTLKGLFVFVVCFGVVRYLFSR